MKLVKRTSGKASVKNSVKKKKEREGIAIVIDRGRMRMGHSSERSWLSKQDTWL